MTDDILDDPFHAAAWEAAILALSEGRFHDSAYVKKLAYEFYEEDLKKKNAKK